jgi:cell wall integrity and stress response component
MKSSTIISGALVAASQFYTALGATPVRIDSSSHVIRANIQVPSQQPVPGAVRSAGCWSSKGNLTDMSGVDPTKVSSGYCNNLCKAKQYPVMGLQGASCFCGMAYPPADDTAADSDCTYKCPAYGGEACGTLGSPGFFSIWNTGINIDPPNYVPPSTTTSSSSSSSSSTSSDAEKSSAAANPSSPATQSAEATPSDAPSGGSKKTNVAGIAAGTVVGVVVLGGLLGAAFFTMRRRRNAEIEEEHRRNAAVNAFINGSKPPSTSGSISMTDSRLDPVMAHRRLSDGSIADNEDYSRRILRVSCGCRTSGTFIRLGMFD